MEFVIEKMNASDWSQVRSIYLEGMATGNATLETEAPDWQKWNSSHLPHSRLVARQDGRVIGWAALSPVSSRCVYAGVAEISIYVEERSRGNGIGTALLRELISLSEQEGIWTLNAGIFPENDASIALHKRNGFREIGTRERIGKLNGVWRDVVLLERRSKIIGIN